MFIAYWFAAKMRPSYGNWDIFLDETNDFVNLYYFLTVFDTRAIFYFSNKSVYLKNLQCLIFHDIYILKINNNTS